jgi:hypothetical protein
MPRSTAPRLGGQFEAYLVETDGGDPQTPIVAAAVVTQGGE